MTDDEKRAVIRRAADQNRAALDRLTEVDGRAAWEFEAITRRWVDDLGFVIEEPTGWLTFGCGCGHSLRARNAEAIARGREHVSTEHPTWEQIPEQEDA